MIFATLQKILYRMIGSSPYRKYGIVMGLSGSRRPRCLAPFQAEFTPAPAKEVSEKNSFISYALRCKCGCDYFLVGGVRSDAGEHLMPPVSLECGRCRKRSMLFDHQRDGHDAFLYPRGAASIMPDFTLPDSRAIIVSFEYSIGDDEVTAIPGFFKDAPELFTWFCLYGTKDGAAPEMLFDWECS